MQRISPLLYINFLFSNISSISNTSCNNSNINSRNDEKIENHCSNDDNNASNNK